MVDGGVKGVGRGVGDAVVGRGGGGGENGGIVVVVVLM